MKKRLDKLGALGTSIVTISGGEPMMHPELDDIIHHIRMRGMIAGLDLEWLLLHAGANQATEQSRPRISANQHRQRRSG